MIRKAWDIVSIVAVANMLAMGILFLILAIGGGLTPSKARMIRDVIADKPLPVIRVVTSAPDTDLVLPSTAGQLIAREQAGTQILQLQIDQQLRELKDFQAQLDQARAALDARIAQFEQGKKSWLAQRDAEQALIASDGFKKSMALYEQMSPEQAKDLFMTMEDTEVVRFLSSMEERKAAKIAKAFQTDPEKSRLKKVLDRLEKPLLTDRAAGVADKPAPEGPAGAPKTRNP